MRRSHTDPKLPELEREHPSTLWGCWWTSWSAQCCTLTLIRPCKIYIGNGISEYIVVSLEFILGSWVPANLKGCSRAEDFDTKWVHIKKTGALWSVYDGSPEQKYPFIGKVLWSNLIPGSRGSSSSSFRFFFSCHHLPEGVDLCKYKSSHIPEPKGRLPLQIWIGQMQVFLGALASLGLVPVRYMI